MFDLVLVIRYFLPWAGRVRLHLHVVCHSSVPGRMNEYEILLGLRLMPLLLPQKVLPL